MTFTKMNRHLDTLSQQQITDIVRMIRDGNGARIISLSYPATIQQVNAVFALLDSEVAYYPYTVEQAERNFGC